MTALEAIRGRLIRPRRVLLQRSWGRRAGLWCGAIVVALVAGAFAVAADRAAGLFQDVISVHPWLALPIVPAGLVVSVLLTRRVFPGAQGSGIPQAIAALHLANPALIDAVLSLRIAIGKLGLTLLGLACGASIGREGPTVQVGASIMSYIAVALGLPAGRWRHAFILAGGAAGIAAAFNTPLAGVVFAIEELAHSFEARASGAVLTAVVIGGIVTQALFGNYTYFGVSSAQVPVGAGWAGVAICALCGGLLGGLFSRVLLIVAAGLPGRAGKWLMRRPLLFAGLCGVLLAGLGLVSGGATYGTGYAQARSLVEGHADVPQAFFLLKLAATTLSYLSGIPGGIFAPSLAIGAGLGHLLSGLVPAAPAGAVVLLGMVAYFAGVVQAPITAAVIVLEMTDNQSMTIPLMATSFLAFGASRLVCRRPLYGALARRFLWALERRA